MSDHGQSEEGRAIPLRYEVPLDIQSKYATHMVVHHSEHEFVIYFFEAKEPIILGTQEEIRSKLEATESILAECVARIIVAAERMPSFVEALQTNLDKYLAAREEKDK